MRPRLHSLTGSYAGGRAVRNPQDRRAGAGDIVDLEIPCPALPAFRLNNLDGFKGIDTDADFAVALTEARPPHTAKAIVVSQVPSAVVFSANRRC